MIKINIIGLGRVGRVLATVWSRLPDIEIAALYHRTALSADIQAQLPPARLVQDFHQLPAADLWIIAVSDAAILEVATQLAQTGVDFRDAVVCHCSGLLTSEQLLPLRQKGAAIASCHPILSFASHAEAIAHFPGCYVGLEGDHAAIQCLKPKLQALGAYSLEISSQAKVFYHLMAVTSGNFSAILLDLAAKCAEKAGIDQKTALSLVTPLMASTLASAQQHSPAEALSGPFARLDRDSIQMHVTALQQSLPEQLALYAALGKAALQLNPHHSAEALEKKAQIAAILE